MTTRVARRCVIILHPLKSGRGAWIGGEARAAPGLAKPGELLRSQFFGYSHRSALADDNVHEKPLLLVRFERKKHFGVTYGYSAMLKKGLSIRIEIQKSHGVGYRGPALAHPLGDLVLSQSEIPVKPCVGAGLFDGIRSSRWRFSISASSSTSLSLALRTMAGLLAGEVRGRRATDALQQ